VKFLLDTDHITIYQRQSGPEYAALSKRIAQHSAADIAFSVVSFHEQALGGHNYIQRAQTPAHVIHGYDMLSQLLQDYTSATVLPFDTAAAAVFYALSIRRLRVGVMDLRIASIALSRGLTVLTRNLRDFRRVPGLLAEDWTV
jgi:tRNA(fMet)-specific endonuclease VapC